jgi:parallel beta-helix repeat protein
LNIDQDPLFVNATTGDLRLLSSASPCVDSGAISTPGLPATDLAGNPRVVDGDRNGTAIVDMGAYEYQSWQIHNITQNNWYERIQFAIDAAASGDEIEVAPGTYNEAIIFKGMAIRLYSSGGPDVTTIDGTGNYHVVQCVNGEDANTILEGFTITGGNANGSSPHNCGGGMLNDGSNPTVTNCTFSGNNAVNDGGGMYNYSNSSLTVTNCTFSNNSASWGGGIYNMTSSPTVTNCTISGNSAVAGGGGGMINYAGSYTMVTNCTFSGNNAATNGGGMWNGNFSNPDVTNCRFSENEAGSYGGGMYNYGSLPRLTNCIFNHNTAQQASGGGIANYSSSNCTITNCTFSGNTTGGDGGGIRNWDSSPIVKNCILWGNEHDEISSEGASGPVVNYSDIRGGHSGTGNINIDPNFVDANNPDPNLVNLRLLPDSPCIDAGDTTVVPSGILVDADGNQRGLDDPASPDTGVNVLGVTVDMGAYEFQICPIVGDVNCDGVVDFKDLAILCNNWLAGTEPEL